MIHLLFVADGPRDEAVVPRVVERILGVPIRYEFTAWKEIRLHSGSGYERRLLYLLRRARERGASGVIATLDSDKERQRRRLSELRGARDKDRAQFAPIPAALGEGVPHLEAWLLDDAVAVRTALEAATDLVVPTVRTCTSPKETLNAIIRECKPDADILLLLGSIASQMHPERCRHSGETGLKSFVDDVRHEFRSCGNG